MRLRYKLNLISVGCCGTMALFLAMAGKLGMSLLMFFWAIFNWNIALDGEAAEAQNKEKN